MGCHDTQCWLSAQVAIQQAATDPVTGAIDMDLIQTGVSASERIARGQLAQEIKKLLISAHLPPSCCTLLLFALTRLSIEMYNTVTCYTCHSPHARGHLDLKGQECTCSAMLSDSQMRPAEMQCLAMDR